MVSTAQSTQPRIGLSPEAKSTLLSGAMASTLGATFFAKPKVQSAYELLNLSKDKFESTTKKAQKLQDGTIGKKSFEQLKKHFENIPKETEENIQRFFGEKTQISVNDVLKNVNLNAGKNGATEAITTAIKDTSMLMAEKSKVLEFVAEIYNGNGMTDDMLKRLDEIYDDKTISKELADFKANIIAQFKEKKTIEDLTTFLDQNIQTHNKQMQNLTIAQRLVNIADDTGIIEKTGANKAVREGVTDMLIDDAKCAYENIQQILPKARIKGALKWFGLGIGVSILSNIIFSRIARAKTNKN